MTSTSIDDPLELNVPESAFPIQIECFLPSGEVVWEHKITEPGPMYVPPLKNLHGVSSGVRVKFAGDKEWTVISPEGRIEE